LRPVADVAEPVIGAQQEGAVVAALRADLAGFGDLAGWGWLAEGALAMARILDDPRHVPTQPSAAKQLASLLDTLHHEAVPRRGRLHAVQQMSDR
jgi:hypothetical protein